MKGRDYVPVGPTPRLTLDDPALPPSDYIASTPSELKRIWKEAVIA
jgi:hypothetical protein